MPPLCPPSPKGQNHMYIHTQKFPSRVVANAGLPTLIMAHASRFSTLAILIISMIGMPSAFARHQPFMCLRSSRARASVRILFLTCRVVRCAAGLWGLPLRRTRVLLILLILLILFLLSLGMMNRSCVSPSLAPASAHPGNRSPPLAERP